MRRRRANDLAPGRANAPPEAVVPVSFNGPPDGSEDHHRGPQQAAHGPRRVSPPSSAAAGAVPSPAVVRQRFGARPLWSAFPARRGISPPPSARRRATTGAFAPRDARPRRTETSSPPRHPLPPAFGAPGRSANGAGPQVRCVAGPRDVRGVDCFGYAGTSVPATALASPSNAAHSRAQALAAATPPDSAGGPGRREFGSVVRRLEGARSAAGPVRGRGPRARGGGAADVAAVEGLAADRPGGPVRGAGGLDLRRQTRPTAPTPESVVHGDRERGVLERKVEREARREIVARQPELREPDGPTDRATRAADAYRHAVQGAQVGVARRDAVAGELRLHDGITPARHEHQPEQDESDRRAHAGGEEDPARTRRWTRNDHARAEVLQPSERRVRRLLDGTRDRFPS